MKTLFASLAVAAVLVPATLAHAEDLQFTLINETDTAVTGFYVSETGSSYWQDNLMAGGYLDSGYEIDVIIADGLTVCAYDIRFVFSDGEALEDYGLDLCDLGSYTVE